MPTEIAHEKWSAFLGAFGHEHAGWQVMLEAHRPGGGKVFQVEGAALQDVLDDQAGGHEQISIVMGNAGQHQTHIVDEPTRVLLAGPQAEPELEIDSRDGSITVVCCRAPQNHL